MDHPKERHTVQRYAVFPIPGCALRAAALLIAIALGLSGCAPLEQSFQSIEDGLTSAVIGTPKDVESISTDRIAYRTLDEDEQAGYDQMLDCILNQEEKVPLSILDEEKVDKVYEAIMADYGELFWVRGYAYRTFGNDDETFGFEFEPTYTMTSEERSMMTTEIDAVVADWLADLPTDADDYTKAKFVYESLIERVDYDRGAENNQNIISVFIQEATVCQGYADAVNYLLWKLGVPSMIVSGSAGGDSHAWNLVQLDGDWYFLDVTWGNSSYLDEDAARKKHTDYAYLNVTSDDLLATHTIDSRIPVRECTATADNYYRREGMYFDTWNDEAIGIALSNAYYNNQPYVSIRLANAALYEQTIAYFIEQSYLASYCEGLEAITYLENPQMGVLTIHYDLGNEEENDVQGDY